MDDTLTRILEELPRLRRDGVLRLTVRSGDGSEVSVELAAPPPAEVSVARALAPPPVPENPLDDRATYPGGRIPKSPYDQHLERRRRGAPREDDDEDDDPHGH